MDGDRDSLPRLRPDICSIQTSFRNSWSTNCDTRDQYPALLKNSSATYSFTRTRRTAAACPMRLKGAVWSSAS